MTVVGAAVDVWFAPISVGQVYIEVIDCMILYRDCAAVSTVSSTAFIINSTVV